MDFSVVLANPDLIGACERYLYLAAQSTIDIAEMVVKNEELGTLESMSESFEKLGVAGILDNNLKDKLIKMVGFRNALSHGYEKLNYGLVEKVLKHDTDDLREFLSLIVAKYNTEA
jgi:uncharacterized protein YutE (UPF0331/DUF86 family)